MRGERSRVTLPLAGDCSRRTREPLSGQEDVEGDLEHLLGLGGALGSAVEAGQHVAKRGVRRFDQMGLRLGLLMRFWRADALEGDVVAGVGIGEDGADLADSSLGQV